MVTRHCLAIAAVFAFASSALAQTAELEAELRLRLTQHQRERITQLWLSAQPKPLPPARGAMPEGAIARLGDTRLRHAAPPRCVVFSPDGQRLYSGGEDGALRVWDATSGAPIKSVTFSGMNPTNLRFTPDGTKLVVMFTEGGMRFFNAETLKEISTLGFAIGSEFALSSDCKMLAAFNRSGTVTGLLTVTELESELPKVELAAGSPFAFHPTNKSLAVADAKGKVTLYMIAGGKPLMTLDHGSPLHGLLFSADGKQLVTGGSDGSGNETLKVWDITDAKNPKVVATIDGASEPRAWIGKNRIAAGGIAAIGVFDMTAKKWVGHVRGVTGAWAISPDGKTVAATSTGSVRVRLWELATGKQLYAENDTFPNAALLLGSADSKSLFVLAGDTAFHWPIAKPTATAAGTLPGKANVAAAGKGRLAVAITDALLIYDDFDPMKPLPKKPSRTISEHATGIRALAVSTDGKMVAYSGQDAKTVIADAATGKAIRTLPTQTIGLALAFSPKNDTVAMIGRDGFFRLWPIVPKPDNPNAALWSLRMPRRVHATVAFSPDGTKVAASSSGVMKVVNAVNGLELFNAGGVFEHGLIQQVVFSPDGTLLLTASEGATGGVQVWDIATQKLVRKFSTGFGTVSHIGIFPDGTRFASDGADEAITVWELTGRK